MKNAIRHTLPTTLLAVGYLAALASNPVVAQGEMAPAAPSTLRLTLEQVKERVLADNKLLQLAARNVQSKDYAARSAQSLYFPQIVGNSYFLHFNDNLGTVLTTPGRTVTGPRGRPLAGIPSVSVDVPVINQNTALNTIAVLQPITDLLKVRQGVKLARADEQIAQAQMEKGTRELLSGVEQLYWGLLVAQKIRDRAAAAVAGAEPLAKTGSLQGRTALIEGKQALQEVSNQITDLQEQLAILLSVPTCTQFELVEPPMPVAPVRCAEEAVCLALANSPEIHEAEQNIAKARAGVAAAKLDYVPSIALFGSYTNQTALSYVQPNIGSVGVVGSYTFVDWGKRRNTIREREELVAMATLKVQQTQDDVRQKTLKAFREYEQTQQATALAEELVGVRQESQKAAKALAEMLKAAENLLTAEVDYLKADLAHRTAYVKLMSLLGRQ